MTSREYLILVFALIACPVAARDDAFQPDAAPEPPSSVREAEPWSEGATSLPPWPDQASLVYFPVDGGARGFRYAIDERSLQVGADEVVRYTLVVESPSGTQNVSFEGIRCTPNGAYRAYAYGADGRFAQIADGNWLPISGGRDPSRYDLWRSYLCVHLKFTPRPRAQILRALRRGRLSDVEGTGFMAD